ncbi:MAG: polyprenol monophosphomannose synthase [Candidatus Sumerlaeota bacterium]|nr:polyprenol monophosphomannose synthase [Candidatus Sumerlaeota bacterium]
MDASSSPKVVVIVATYNERENVQRLLPLLLQSPMRPGVIIVDDNSPDGTGAVVRLAAESAPGRVDLIERSGKLGYGSAFVEGFRRALECGADIIVTMDADFSHDPQAIPSLVAALGQYDLAIGSRYVGGIRILNWGMNRLLLSTAANRYINAILRFGLTDCTSGFRAYRSAVLRSIELGRASARGYAFLVEILEMAYRKQFRITEVPIVYTERETGRSKMSRGVILEAVFRPWQLLLRRLWTPR